MFLIGFIAIAIVFAIKLPDIKGILEKTQFLEKIKQKSASTTITVPESSKSNKPEISTPTTIKTSTTTVRTPPTSVKIPSITSIQEKEKPETPEPSKAPTTAEAPARQSSLFFVRIGEDGLISRHEVKRSIPISDSPLTDAINALLQGPSEGEIRSGMVSLIPRGTRLLGLVRKGNTAFIDLSEEFMYNHYGVEGYMAQLRQIVYTATSFSSVQDVQMLIEGSKKQFLGEEGVYIEKPLSRISLGSTAAK